ncbi:MAG: phosphoenolpyruvate--protein phosphotransferase [Pyrinomonadaceae bacterium]
MEVNLAEIGSQLYSMDDTAASAERRITGLSVSHGIGIGRLVFFQEGDPSILDASTSSPDDEIVRIRSAADACRNQLNELLAANASDAQPHVIDIFDLQLLILDQSSLITRIESHILENSTNAESALKCVSDELVGRQSGVADQHLREKHLDIADVCNRLEAALHTDRPTSGNEYSGSIIAAHELRPSMMLELKKSRPVGVITERGGWTSHTSILAREFQIPMVSGISLDRLKSSVGENIVVDGQKGLVVVEPTELTLAKYEDSGSKRGTNKDADEVATNPFKTLDGHEIAVRANVDSPEAFELARKYGAKGVGLFRSESLIRKAGEIPDEDSQVAAYRKIAQVAGENGVRIRTFDIGVDFLRGNPSRTEVNPSLGLRSIRLSLHEKEHFRTQIRAILRASPDNKIDILLPMVSGVAEMVAAKQMIAEESDRLAEEGIAFGEPKLGAMIEVPSGVMTARDIIRHADFMALGTNDLVQYLLAIDRDNESVAEWYQTLHPAVIRSIREVISAATDAGKPVLVCGEMAGSAFYVPILIGLGATQLSMNINSIKQIRRLISGITLAECSKLIQDISGCETSEKTESILRSHYHQHWADLFPPGLLDAKHR